MSRILARRFVSISAIVVLALLAPPGCADRNVAKNPVGDQPKPEAKADVVEVGDHVWVEYTGKLQDGKTFDSSVGKDPIDFTVGTVGRGGMIRGFDQGVVGMKKGQSKTLTIPPEDAYGARGMPPMIPPNATLNFQVKIVDLAKSSH